MPHPAPPPSRLHDRQRAKLTLRIGRRARLQLAAEVSPAGLLAAGALVSGILLSSAAIVAAARPRLQASGRDRIQADTIAPATSGT